MSLSVLKIAHYHILNCRICLTTDDHRVFDTFDRDYNAFKKSDTRPPVDMAVTVFQKNGGLHLTINDLSWPIDGPHALHCVYHKILDHLHQHLAQRFFLIHAGAVAREGQAILIGGPAGAGKSTLTLALTRLGYGFMSDDLAPLDRITGMVNPFPRALWIADPNVPPICGHLRSGKSPVSMADFGDRRICDPQQPKALLWLTSGTEGGSPSQTLRLTLDPSGETEILEALRKVESVTLSCNPPHTWRVCASDIPEVNNKLKHILQAFDARIWQVYREQHFKGDYSRPPQITPCPPTEMAMHLIRELKQVPWLEFQTRSAARWLMELTSLLSRFCCYELQVGNLSDTLDLISPFY
jgi:hypothetical protein